MKTKSFISAVAILCGLVWLARAQDIDSEPPVVIKTIPEAGSKNVPAGEYEVIITFSKDMTDGSWSWSTAWENSTPETIGVPHYEADHRTCVLKVKLEPGQTYGWWLNSQKFRNFRDMQGHAAVPYLLTFATSAEVEKPSAGNPAQTGWQLWQSHDYEGAAAKFREAVAASPNDANSWNGLGWALFNGGKADDAIEPFQKVISLQPDHPAALNGLGQIYLSERKYDDAEKYLLKAAPKAPAAWYGLARLYLLEGKFADAEHWAQNLVDAGQADETVKKMLEVAQKKNLSEGLRLLIEPAQPSLAAGTVGPAAGASTGKIDPATGLLVGSGASIDAAAATEQFPTSQKLHGEIEGGQYEEALQTCLDYHDKYKTSGSLIFMLSDWIELGRRYPPARKALIDIRDRDVQEFAAGRGFSELFSEVHSINQSLQDNDSTYALFNSFRDKDLDLARQCYLYVQDILVAKGDYQYCYDHIGSAQARFDQIHENYDRQVDSQKRFEEMQRASRQGLLESLRQRGLTNMAPPPDTLKMMNNSAKQMFVGQTRDLIEILVGTGHNDDAKKVQTQALAVLDDPLLQSAVADVSAKLKK